MNTPGSKLSSSFAIFFSIYQKRLYSILILNNWKFSEHIILSSDTMSCNISGSLSCSLSHTHTLSLSGWHILFFNHWLIRNFPVRSSSAFSCSWKPCLNVSRLANALVSVSTVPCTYRKHCLLKLFVSKNGPRWSVNPTVSPSWKTLPESL